MQSFDCMSSEVSQEHIIYVCMFIFILKKNKKNKKKQRIPQGDFDQSDQH